MRERRRAPAGDDALRTVPTAGSDERERTDVELDLPAQAEATKEQLVLAGIKVRSGVLAAVDASIPAVVNLVFQTADDY